MHRDELSARLEDEGFWASATVTRGRQATTAVLGTANGHLTHFLILAEKTTTGGTNVHGDGRLSSANSAVCRGPLVHTVGATVEACACNGLMYRYVAGTWPTIRGGDDEALSSL